MIQHVVMWRLIDLDDAERAAALKRFGTELQALVGVVPGLLSVALTPDVRDAESNFDVALISIHESREALATYQSHPEHVAIGTWWGLLVAQRGAVDSEI
ncbi:MAG: Dabb family protein [Microbacteriaceae bacterium]|nr:Dabb family protein [Microbacteriaceae bacterium]